MQGNLHRCQPTRGIESGMLSEMVKCATLDTGWANIGGNFKGRECSIR